MKSYLITLVLLASLFLSSCNSHLYNQGKNDIAVKASETFEEVELEESIKREYDLLDTLLTQELAMVEKLTLERRDTRLWKIIYAYDEKNSTQFLQEEVDKRLKELVGDPEKFSSFIQLKSQIEEKNRSIVSAIDAYGSNASDDNSPSVPSNCSEVDKEANIADPIAKVLYDNIIKLCDDLASLEEKQKAYKYDGLIKETNQLISQVENAMKSIQDTKKANADSLKSKKEAYEKAVETNDPKVAQLAEELKSTIKEFEISILEIPKGFEKFGLEGKLHQLQSTDSAVNTLLDMVIANPDTVDDNLNAETKRLLEMVSTVDKFEGHINALKFPQVSRLLLEKEYLKAEIDGLKKEIELAQKRLDYLKEKNSLMIQEATLLGKSKQNIDALLKVSPTKSYADIIVSGSDAEKKLASFAMTYYSASWTLPRQGQEKIDYQIHHLDHLSSLHASSKALKQWNSLIKIPLNQLVEWEARGIKPEQLSGLIQALGFAGVIYTN